MRSCGAVRSGLVRLPIDRNSRFSLPTARNHTTFKIPSHQYYFLGRAWRGIESRVLQRKPRNCAAAIMVGIKA